MRRCTVGNDSIFRYNSGTKYIASLNFSIFYEIVVCIFKIKNSHGKMINSPILLESAS